MKISIILTLLGMGFFSTLPAQAVPNNIFFKTLVPRGLFPIADTSPLRNMLPAQDSQAHLNYYSGPVLSNVKIVAVFWTSSVNSTVTEKMGTFYGTMTNSTYIDWLKEYDTNIKGNGGSSGTNQSIGRGSFVGNYTVSPSVTSGTIDDTAIQTELAKQVASGKLPVPDENTLYMVHFPPGITITMGGYTSCQDFCAYHSAYKDGTKDLYYGVMPDFASSACSQGCGDSDDFSNFTSAASHEVVESITDPQVGYVTGSNPTSPMAWYDPNLGESGDICVGTNGTVTASDGTAFNVQGIWSNSENACIQAKGVLATGTPEQSNLR